jgi:hypothetical protein
MTVPVTVSERDLVALLGIVTDHRGADPGDGLPLSLLHQLVVQVPSEAVSFFGLDSRQQTIWFGQSVPAGDRAQVPGKHLQPAPGVQQDGSRHPCLRRGAAARSRPDAELIALPLSGASSNWHER